MAPLRIIVVCVEPPLPFGNAAARWYYVLVKGLVERGHRVTTFATCSKPTPDIGATRELFPAPQYDVRPFAHPERRGLFSKVETFRRPYSYMFSPELKTALRAELAAGFDVLHLEQLWAGWLGLNHPDRALLNVHHLQWIDLENTRPQGWQAWYERRQIVQTERRLLRGFKYIRSCSPRLEPEIRRVNAAAEITNVPVGLDPAQYEFILQEQRPPEPILSLIGSMGWYPSSSAAVRLLTRLWPSIKAQVPEAKLQIVGWSAKSVLREYLQLPDVTIEENVPDTRPYFARTAVMAYAPARGSGMKIKILEALGFGIPVVTTSEGIEGLPAEDGVHAGVCEDDAGLISRIVALLRDRDRQERQRRAGRELLERHCGPGPTLDGIEAIYRKIAGGKQ